MTGPRGELTVDELLGDPIVELIMKADRVDLSEFAVTLRLTAHAVKRRQKLVDKSRTRCRWAVAGACGQLQNV